MKTENIFKDLKEHELFTIDRRDLTRVSTRQTREVNLYAAASFTHKLFAGIHSWVETVNDALALGGWRLVWSEQRLRVYDKKAREYVYSSRPFSPDPKSGRPLPHARADQLFLRVERLPSP